MAEIIKEINMKRDIIYFYNNLNFIINSFKKNL